MFFVVVLPEFWATYHLEAGGENGNRLPSDLLVDSAYLVHGELRVAVVWNKVLCIVKLQGEVAEHVFVEEESNFGRQSHEVLRRLLCHLLEMGRRPCRDRT